MRMPNESGIDDVRGYDTANVASFVLVAALIQAILLPVLLPIAVTSRTIFGRPWMVQVRWADMATEIAGGSWSESATLIQSLARQVEQTGSLLGTPVFP